MSKTECPGTAAQTKCRFKGVENFLKRVAFNLGNSPSQTEVKIISCIPIDVSDLQQKILSLEKQLEETRCFQMSNCQKPVINTAICECPPVSNTAVLCNMLDIDRATSPCRPPHSHRRHSARKKSNVSFAVPSGNSCSCLTIDKTPPEDKCFSDMPYNNCLDPYIMDASRSNGGRKNFFKKKKKCFKPKKPKAHCVCYAQTKYNPFKITTNKIEMVPKEKNMSRTYLAEMINKQYKPRPLGGNLSDISKFSSPVCRDTQDYNRTNFYDTDLCSCFHEGFQNIDSYLIKHPCEYQSNELHTRRYYDSTQYDVIPVKEKTKSNFDVSKKREMQSYFNFNYRPVGWDTKHPRYNDSLPPKKANNLCKIRKKNRQEPIPLVRNLAKRKNKTLNIDKKINIRESKSCSVDFGTFFCDIQKYPKLNNKADKCLDVIQIPRKNYAQCLSAILNDNGCQTEKEMAEPNSDIRTENTLNKIKSILQSVIQEVKVTSVRKCSTDGKLRKDEVVYKKESLNNALNSQQDEILINLQGKNGENLQCNVFSDVTGNTPNSLLGNREKGHNYMANNFSGAIPVNMQIPYHMQESRLLNSFTYSPYNTSQYMPSASKQLHSNLYCYPPNGFKYIQNYPLFINNPERHLCTSCCRQNSQLKPCYHKQVTTIATNTDKVNEEPGKEIHKLINEIYKSVALSMSVDKKDNPLGELDVLVKIPTNTNQVDISKESIKEKLQPINRIKPTTTVVQPVAELFRNNNTWISSESRNTLIQNTPESIEISVCSLTDTDINGKSKVRKLRLENLLKLEKQSASKEITQVTTTSETERTTSETTTEEVSNAQLQPNNTLESREKKKKVSLFTKMLKSVKQFRQRHKNKCIKIQNSVETQESEEVTSDSDDYQTIYSHKINRPVKHIPRSRSFKRRTHSKISYKQAYQTDRSPTHGFRRSPYMEQENRRQWNERIMFNNNKYGQSSERPTYSYDYSSEPFYQSFEARTALGHPKKTLKPINNKRIVPKMTAETEPKATSKGLAWLKSHNMGLKCNRQHWKNVIVDS